jgi:KEOPS complex subunit Pcc1
MKMRVISTFETDYAENICLAMLPELDRPVTDRSAINLKADDNVLILEVAADDLISMRSTLNTWYRLVNVAYETFMIANMNNNLLK